MNSTQKNSNKTKEFREIRKYYAAAMESGERNAFNEELRKNDKNYYQIGTLSHASYFYKYYSLNVALMCLKYGNMQFVEPSRWQDKYERRFYEANYKSQTDDEKADCPMLFATCMTTSGADEAAWSLYTYNKTGLGAFCVKFQINKHKLRQQLVKALNVGDTIYEGTVKYYGATMIDNIHRKQIEKNGKMVDNEDYQLFVQRKEKTPYITNYLNLLLMKRPDFEHEKETRFFIQKKIKESSKNEIKKAELKIENEKVVYGKTILLNIDWIEVIEKVYINAKEDSWEYQLLSNALRKKIENAYLHNNSIFEDEEENTYMREKMEQIWNERLKPVPYFVYGEDLEKPLIME